MKQMTTSKLGRSLIKHFEGLRLDAYRCAAGRLTIGWGHTAGVRPGQHITVAEAERLLTADIAPIERLLNVLDLDLSQEQFDALVSWIFNLGRANFEHSTLLRRLMEGASKEEVAAQIVRWTYADGRQLRGLMERRAVEANTFLGRELYVVEDGRIRTKIVNTI